MTPDKGVPGECPDLKICLNPVLQVMANHMEQPDHQDDRDTMAFVLTWSVLAPMVCKDTPAGLDFSNCVGRPAPIRHKGSQWTLELCFKSPQFSFGDDRPRAALGLCQCRIVPCSSQQ